MPSQKDENIWFMKTLCMRIGNVADCRHDYVVNQRVIKKWYKPTKLGLWISGPYRVAQTHVNGTLTIELQQGVTERINIRRVTP